MDQFHLDERQLEQCIINNKHTPKSSRNIGKNSRKKTESRQKDEKKKVNKKKHPEIKTDKKADKFPKPNKDLNRNNMPNSVARTKLPKIERLTRRSTEKMQSILARN